MTNSEAQINLNFPVLYADFFRRLQHFLDMIRLLETAVDNVSEAQVAETKRYMSFNPAQDAGLQHEETRAFSRTWLQTRLLRDAIEAKVLFLDECLSKCAVVRLASTGEANGAELERIFNVLPLQ